MANGNGRWPAPGWTSRDSPRFPHAALGQDTLSRLVPRFSTDFTRETWMVEDAGAVIEVALDAGEIRAGERTATIRELELELKEGKEAPCTNSPPPWLKACPCVPRTPARPPGAELAARAMASTRGRHTRRLAASCRRGLDALGDTGEPAWRHEAQAAFRQLAALGDDPAGDAHWLAGPGG